MRLPEPGARQALSYPTIPEGKHYVGFSGNFDHHFLALVADLR